MTVQDSDQMKTSLAFQKCRFFSIAIVIAIAIIISMPSELSSHHRRYPNCHHHLECDQHQHHLDCDRHQSSALPDPTLAPTPEQIAQHRSSPLNNVQTNKHQSWLLSTVHHPLKSFESLANWWSSLLCFSSVKWQGHLLRCLGTAKNNQNKQELIVVLLKNKTDVYKSSIKGLKTRRWLSTLEEPDLRSIWKMVPWCWS